MQHVNFGQGLAEKLERLLTDSDQVIPSPLGPGNLLGVFVKSTSQTIPAIYVGQIPSIWSTSGLQCIVDMLPATAQSYHQSNPDGYGRVIEKGMWRFTLRQFPVTQSVGGIYSESDEQLDSTIELAHARIMSWASEVQMRQINDNTKTTSYLELVYLVPYDWVYDLPLGIAGPL
jgi:hypothetical protein